MCGSSSQSSTVAFRVRVSVDQQEEPHLLSMIKEMRGRLPTSLSTSAPPRADACTDGIATLVTTVWQTKAGGAVPNGTSVHRAPSFGQPLPEKRGTHVWLDTRRGFSSGARNA